MKFEKNELLLALRIRHNWIKKHRKYRIYQLIGRFLIVSIFFFYLKWQLRQVSTNFHLFNLSKKIEV